MPDINRLTPKEKSVMLLMAESLSNKEIARLLAIEASTVKSYVSSILSKLGLQSRLQVSLFAVTSGLVRLDAEFYEQVLGSTVLAAPPAELTPRQVDIVRMAALGLCLKDMARRLHISLYTVKAHLQNVLRRLHVTDRYAVIISAIRHGLISLDEVRWGIH